MLIQFLLWLFIALIGTAIGLALLRIVRPNAKVAPDAAFLIGLTALCSGLAYWSLFFPVNGGANIFFVSLTALLFFFAGVDIRSWGKELRSTALDFKRPFLAAGILLSLITLAYSVQMPEVYDSALYHVQAIKWIKDYAVVPGLGNLHGRFAFNAHFFLLSAFFSGWSAEQMFFPVNGLVLCVFCWRVIWEIQQALQSKQIKDLIFYLIVGILALFFLIRICHSPTPDIFVAVLLLFAGIYGYKCIRTMQQEETSALKLAACGAIALAPTIKLSALLGFALIPAIIPWNWRHYWKIAVASSLMLLPFFLRNIFLSGYLIFPFPGLDLFDVDWKIPLSEVIAEKRYIETWARIVSYDVSRIAGMSLKDWLPLWWQNQNGLWKVLLLTLTALPVLMFAYATKRQWRKSLLYAALCLNILFWFVSAPDTRFALGFLLLSASLCLSELAGLVLRPNSIQSYFWKMASWLLLLSLLGILAVAGLKIRLSPAKLYRPEPMESGKVRAFNRNGFSINIPPEGERCFECPLPCAPELNERLELRGSHLQQGFRCRE